MAEGHGWFLKRYDSVRALQFLSMVEAIPMQILSVGFKEQRAAATLLRKYPDQDLTVTDATGLHIMSSRNVRICWSTNFHLGLTKVPLVIYT